jgi:hypothetical protein
MAAYHYFELTDLSATGAKLSGSRTPDIGMTALLRLDDFEVLCKVVWVAERECGVHFEELIPPKVLARFRESGSTSQVEMLKSEVPAPKIPQSAGEPREP